MNIITFFKKEDAEMAAKIKAATSVRMDEVSREKTRALLSEYMKMRPIREAEPVEHKPSTYASVEAFFTRHTIPAVTAVLVLVVSGSTAAAAESALPGDVLYPIKVHVNEEVRATAAVSPKAKADWAVARAERRLEEAATLALVGQLDDETRAELDTNLDAHVKSASESQQQLEDDDDASDASEVRANIDAVVIARANILDGTVAIDGGRSADVAAMTMSAMTVRATQPEKSSNEDTRKAEGSESTKKGHRTAAKVRIEAAKKFLDHSPASLSADTREQVETQIKTATDALSSGDSEATEGNGVEASSHFDSALQSATEIETIISVSKESSARGSTADELKNEVLNEDDDSDGVGGEHLEIKL